MSALSVLLTVLPALALVLSLVRGHYPGERALSRWRARPRRVSGAPPWAPVPTRAARRRSGELLAGAIAGRGPPPALA